MGLMVLPVPLSVAISGYLGFSRGGGRGVGEVYIIKIISQVIIERKKFRAEQYYFVIKITFRSVLQALAILLRREMLYFA